MKIKSKEKIDINQLSSLANIPLSKNEKASLKNDLEETISYIDILNQLNTKKTTPIFQTTRLVNVFTNDIVKKCLSLKVAVSNAPKKLKGYFVSKKVLWQ
jgi:aspartyl-tRNA(Asn)/glutamyl-tRNA(Gln) amidotransferase subunit C